MWRLTVERTYDIELMDKMTEVSSEIVYETDSLHDIHSVINFTNNYGIGKFKYEIEYVPKEGEKQC